MRSRETLRSAARQIRQRTYADLLLPSLDPERRLRHLHAHMRGRVEAYMSRVQVDVAPPDAYPRYDYGTAMREARSEALGAVLSMLTRPSPRR